VTLEDEFTSETANLGSVILELPPVAIDGQLPFDPFTHQTCYAHPGGTLDTCVDVQDAFGVAPVRVGNPAGVCVPELGAVIAVDGFKCYAATGVAPDVELDVADDFQSQTVTVGAPELLCTPVSIDEEPLVNPLRYLVCYATSPTGVAGGQIMVENVLHASPISVDVGVATGVCVPAVRQVVPTCQLCSNGTLDGTEECDDANLQDGDGCSSVCRFELDCTCDGVPVAPPNDQGCATLADCGAACTACTGGGGAVCGCQ
jgi:cysteine-rich repeat protein